MKESVVGKIIGVWFLIIGLFLVISGAFYLLDKFAGTSLMTSVFGVMGVDVASAIVGTLIALGPIFSIIIVILGILAIIAAFGLFTVE